MLYTYTHRTDGTIYNDTLAVLSKRIQTEIQSQNIKCHQNKKYHLF